VRQEIVEPVSEIPRTHPSRLPLVAQKQLRIMSIVLAGAAEGDVFIILESAGL
jgi:hypothetical protein